MSKQKVIVITSLVLAVVGPTVLGFADAVGEGGFACRRSAEVVTTSAPRDWNSEEFHALAGVACKAALPVTQQVFYQPYLPVSIVIHTDDTDFDLAGPSREMAEVEGTWLARCQISSCEASLKRVKLIGLELGECFRLEPRDVLRDTELIGNRFGTNFESRQAGKLLAIVGGDGFTDLSCDGMVEMLPAESRESSRVRLVTCPDRSRAFLLRASTAALRTVTEPWAASAKQFSNKPAATSASDVHSPNTKVYYNWLS